MLFEPLPGPQGFGAQLAGGAVAPAALASVSDADVAALAAALDAHSLLVLRCERAASAAELAAFATKLLGEDGLVDFSGTGADARNQGAGGALCHAPGVPAVRVLGNVTDAAGAAKALLCRIGYEWHNDGMGDGVFSILSCLATPESGGATLFASTSDMYARLSPEQQAFADSAVVVHSNRYTAGGPAAVDGECGVRMDATGTQRVRAATTRRDGWSLNESRTPLVTRHARSGLPVLVGGGKNVDHLAGMEPEASCQALGELLRAGLMPTELSPVGAEDLLPTGKTTFAPQAVLEYQWHAHDIVIWDNQALLHSTTPVCLYGPGARMFHHIIGTDVRRLGADAKAAGGDYGAVQRDAFFLGAPPLITSGGD